jgi:hypothetical protein
MFRNVLRKEKMELLGYGVFSWGADERRSNRYGSFNLCSKSYEGQTSAKTPEHTSELRRLDHKRVKLMVRIIETRKSEHVGDLALGIKPTTPEVGQEFILGVGILQLESCPWDSLPSISLVPKDGRAELWYDPRILYQIHHQTVELYGEETEEDFHEAPVIEFEEGANKIDAESIKAPKDLGDGTFIIVQVFPAKGTKMRVASDGRITWEP